MNMTTPRHFLSLLDMTPEEFKAKVVKPLQMKADVLEDWLKKE